MLGLSPAEFTYFASALEAFEDAVAFHDQLDEIFGASRDAARTFLGIQGEDNNK